MFETKIAIILRNDLEPWQALNVTAFLSSGITGHTPDLLGETYVDAQTRPYCRLLGQPVIVLAADAALLLKIHGRAVSRNLTCAAYTDAMFSTGNDTDNRAAFSVFDGTDPCLVGLGLHAPKNIVDKVTKGARMHP